MQAPVKWTTLGPCTCLSESDSKLHTNFECCEKKIVNNFWKYWSTKPSNLCWQNNLKKSPHILEYGASGDIEQVSKFCLKYNKNRLNQWFSTKENYFKLFFDDNRKFIMNSRDMKMHIRFKIVKVMKFTSKTKRSYLLLSITLNDRFQRSNLRIPHLST